MAAIAVKDDAIHFFDVICLVIVGNANVGRVVDVDILDVYV